ncbi:MAG TPA: hypothetical protein VFX70_07175 [Mycobacteriales bacterium]|nr:hypothetical protein [Mycobacteriales bacterium]
MNGRASRHNPGEPTVPDRDLTGDVDSDLVYAGSPYRVLAHDPNGEGGPPPLPAGHGGVAVHTWCPPAAQRHTLAPIVGVDGEPASYGWGHVLIVLPAGEHLVEVQYVEPMRTIPVTVTAGQVVPVEYAAARDGVPAGAPGRRRPRRRSRRGRAFSPVGYAGVVLAALVVFEAGLALARAAGLSVGVAGVVVGVVAVAVAVLGGVAVYRHQQRPARRSRRRSTRTPR